MPSSSPTKDDAGFYWPSGAPPPGSGEFGSATTSATQGTGSKPQSQCMLREPISSPFLWKRAD